MILLDNWHDGAEAAEESRQLSAAASDLVALLETQGAIGTFVHGCTHACVCMYVFMYACVLECMQV